MVTQLDIYNMKSRNLNFNTLIGMMLLTMTFATYGASITVKNEQFAYLKKTSVSQPGDVTTYANVDYTELCLITGFSLTQGAVYYPNWASPLTKIDGYTGFLTPEGLLIVLSGGTLTTTVKNISNATVSTGLNFGSSGQITLSGPGIKLNNACWTNNMGGYDTTGGILSANIDVSIYVPKNVSPGVYPLPELSVGRYGMRYNALRTIVDSNDVITVPDSSPKCTVNVPGAIDFGTILSQPSSGDLLKKEEGNISYQCTGDNPTVDVTMRATSTSQKENNNSLYLIKDGASTIMARLQGVLDSTGANECDGNGKRISFDGSPVFLGSVPNNNAGQFPLSWLLCAPVGGVNEFGSGKATATLEFDWK